jgi:hypothetical protein
VVNRRRRARNGSEMARPVTTTAAPTWWRRDQLGRWAGPVQGDTSLVGKGRRPAAAIRWYSNPLRPCSNDRGSGREGAVTCRFVVLVVTARALRDPRMTNAVRTQSGPGPWIRTRRPPSVIRPASLTCHTAVRSGLWRPLGPTSRAMSSASMVQGYPRMCAVTSGGMAHRLRADGAQGWPCRASGPPTRSAITGWLAGPQVRRTCWMYHSRSNPTG